MAKNLGSTVRHNVNAVAARLNGTPDTAAEWQTIARQLRAAADAARKVAKLAERMADSVLPSQRRLMRARMCGADQPSYQSPEAAQ